MKKQNALIDYTHVGEDEIVDVGRLIQTEMTDHAATFPTPPVGIPVLTGQLDSYELIKSAPIYPNKTEDLGAARNLINTSLHDNGIYVNTVAKGDLVKLGLSGYPISKLPTPVGDLPAPVSCEIKNGAPQSFTFDIDPVEHAVGYLIATAPVSNTETDPNLWRISWSSKHTRSVGGNTHGTEYKFAVCAVGRTDNLSWLLSGTTLFAQ